MKWICAKCNKQIEESLNTCSTCLLPRKLCDLETISQLGRDEREKSWNDYFKEKNYSDYESAIASDLADIISDKNDNNKLYQKLKHNATRSSLLQIRNVGQNIFDGLFKENRTEILRYALMNNKKETLRVLKRTVPDVIEELYSKHSGDHIPVKCICGCKPSRIADKLCCMTEGCSVYICRVVAENAKEWNTFIAKISGET